MSNGTSGLTVQGSQRLQLFTSICTRKTWIKSTRRDFVGKDDCKIATARFHGSLKIQANPASGLRPRWKARVRQFEVWQADNNRFPLWNAASIMSVGNPWDLPLCQYYSCIIICTQLSNYLLNIAHKYSWTGDCILNEKTIKDEERDACTTTIPINLSLCNPWIGQVTRSLARAFSITNFRYRLK